jgi:hypothetical protein
VLKHQADHDANTRAPTSLPFCRANCRLPRSSFAVWLCTWTTRFVTLIDVLSLAGTKEVVCQNWMVGRSTSKAPATEIRCHLVKRALCVSTPSKPKPMTRQITARIVGKNFIGPGACHALSDAEPPNKVEQTLPMTAPALAIGTGANRTASNEKGNIKTVICSSLSTISADTVRGYSAFTRQYRIDKITFGTIRRRKRPRSAPKCIRHDFIIESLDKTSPRARTRLLSPRVKIWLQSPTQVSKNCQSSF